MSDIESAMAVLANRCAAIDRHYERFPNTVELTMAETAAAMRTVMAEVRDMAEEMERLTAERDEAVKHLRAMSHVAPRGDEVLATHAFLEALAPKATP